MEFPPAPDTDYGALAARLDGSDADAYVHLGDRCDADRLYLTRFEGTAPFVYADGTATVLVHPTERSLAERRFPGDRVRVSEAPPVDRVLAALADADVRRVLLPEETPLDAVEALRAEVAVETTGRDDLAAARAVKTAGEREHLAAVAAAHECGLARAETVLAAAAAESGLERGRGPGGDGGSGHEGDGTHRDRDREPLTREGAPLTTERIRRQVAAAMAEWGVYGEGTVVVGAGETCAVPHFTGDEPVRPGETVLADVARRGPAGFYGDCTRTWVVGHATGWARAAYRTVDRALDAALSTVGPGVPASDVHRAVVEVIEDAGYPARGVDGGDVESGFWHPAGHGVGLSAHERPWLTDDRSLRPGHVVAIEPGVYEPGRGGVRLEDLVVVTEDGYRNLVGYPRSIEPRERSLPTVPGA